MFFRRKRKILVFGLAKSGQSALRLLLESGMDVIAGDEDPGITMPEDLSGVETVLGEFSPKLLQGVEEIVISPGIPGGHPLMAEAARKGIPVIGELELAFKACRAPVIAVTGTNGKSTTVSMIGEILREEGKQVIVAGNVGVPFSSVARKLDPDGFFVIEVSSFQLEAVRDFHPVSAGILNLTPDHLDRYDGVEKYYRLKERIIENSGEDDRYFYNAEDPRCRRIAENFGGGKVPFSSKGLVEGGVFLEGEHLIRIIPGNEEEIFLEKNELGVVGLHNIENALAAVAALEGLNISAQACRKALSNFKGLPHRMERVAEIGGVVYYNDSKATNVEAVVKSLKDLAGPVVLIAGGYDKGSDYSLLGEVMRNIKAVVTIGKAAPLIEKALPAGMDVARADSMLSAVETAAAKADEGDLVVLSPACASFDMFRNFEHRGEVFKESVLELGRRKNAKGN